MFSTSIAVIEGNTVGEASAGYIINLINGDEFWAAKGAGSFMNSHPIKTQHDNNFRVIAYEAQSTKRDISGILPLLSLYGRARCFGSTALDMAFLAQGAISTFIVPSQSRSFDFAAGYLLIKEAGGLVTDLKGQEIDSVEIGVKRSTPLLASANGYLHDKSLNTLRNSDSW